jgi:polysaccharide deacetylase family protein (PEP-CTERM system associated)
LPPSPFATHGALVTQALVARTRVRSSAEGTEVPTHVLGITLEEYFHVGAFRDLIARRRWHRFEPRLEIAAQRVLDLLEESGARATFFTHGWVAERYPALLREIVDRGHEIGNSGYAHRGIRELSPDLLMGELARSRELLEQASGRRVLGTRIPDWIGPGELPLLDRLIAAGYVYDASLRVVGFRATAGMGQLVPFEYVGRKGTIHEFPVPVARIGGFAVPIGGGNWFRQLPAPLVLHAVESWMRDTPAPFSMYFQAWELDPGQPRISAAPWYARVRHYRNLDRMAPLLRTVLSSRQFTGFAGYLGLAIDPVAPAESRPAARGLPPEVARTATPEKAGVSIVVPCFNEAETLPYLMNTLASVARHVDDRYRLHFVFVDDGSRDDTWVVLERLIAARSDCTAVRHGVNQGVAQAILTGLAAAPDELCCSIDADCTYDPHSIGALVDALMSGASLVTASPYHPEGRVIGVPGWRLALSRGLSGLYRRALGSGLHTYTSCFRGYRRSVVADVRLTRSGFLGVAELLAVLVLRGEAVAEVPATLESRLIGRSKMRVGRSIVGHLGLLWQMARSRRGGRGQAARGGSARALARETARG